MVAPAKDDAFPAAEEVAERRNAQGVAFDDALELPDGRVFLDLDRELAFWPRLSPPLLGQGDNGQGIEEVSVHDQLDLGRLERPGAVVLEELPELLVLVEVLERISATVGEPFTAREVEIADDEFDLRWGDPSIVPGIPVSAPGSV